MNLKNENIFFSGSKIKGGGSKNKNLGHLSKLNQILYRYIISGPPEV